MLGCLCIRKFERELAVFGAAFCLEGVRLAWLGSFLWGGFWWVALMLTVIDKG